MSLVYLWLRVIFEIFLGKEWNWQGQGQFYIMSDDNFQEIWLVKPHGFLYFAKRDVPHGNCYFGFYNIGICKFFRVQGIKS